MATAARCLQRCLCSTQTSRLLRLPVATRRPLTISSVRSKQPGDTGSSSTAGGGSRNPVYDEEDGGDDHDDHDLEKLSMHQHLLATLKGEELERYRRNPIPPALDKKLTAEARQLLRDDRALDRFAVPENRVFWGEDEEDEDLRTDEVDEDKFQGDEMLSMAHMKLDEIRDYRHWSRVAAWEMPLLAKFARKFEPPKKEEVLRFRYTTYMGEKHPAEKKVVVEFRPEDLPLSEAQQLKLKKLAGTRYNGGTGIVKMSCEMFEEPAQNKRYLLDLVKKLVDEARNPVDMFEDVPLDNRHWKVKSRPKFPEEWRLTEERKKELEVYRRQSQSQGPRSADAEVGLLGEGHDPEGGRSQRLEERVTVPVR